MSDNWRYVNFSTLRKYTNFSPVKTIQGKITLQEVKSSDYCEYIRPPIDKYKTLQFGSFDEIKEVGYLHGKAYFEGQSRAGNLPTFRSLESTKSQQGDEHLSQYTFTDLAQMVCKVSR